MNKIVHAALMLSLAAGLHACDRSPDIPFAPTDSSLADPDNPSKVFHTDMARVEHDFPLTREERMALTPENIQGFTQEQIDQIYGRLTAGPIPDGGHEGDLFFARGEDLRTRMDEIIGGIGGRLADAKIKTLENVGRHLWKGKMFYRDERVLRNFIEDPRALDALIDRPEAMLKTEIERRGWLGMFDSRTTVYLMFPAKLYCGQSLLDGRRESVIVDYNYADEIPGYQERPDSLAGRNGLRVRDEVRMVRPGFYLGRAYMNRIFLLNFTVYNEKAAEAGEKAFREGAPIEEDCWTGEQVAQAGQN
ncbi:MAG: hypothetical protein AB7O49_08240 [Sphingomonadales bacterium]